MACGQQCPKEAISRDEESPGVIEADESICRAFFPSDSNSAGVKRKAITKSHLWDGQLSVWRLSDRSGVNLEELIDVLDPIMVRKDGEKFDKLGASAASAIRNHSIDGQAERSFCVLDECIMDDKGTKHRAHAHIALCDDLKRKITPDDPIFFALQEGLILLFAPKNPIWHR